MIDDLCYTISKLSLGGLRTITTAMTCIGANSAVFAVTCRTRVPPVVCRWEQRTQLAEGAKALTVSTFASCAGSTGGGGHSIHGNSMILCTKQDLQNNKI